MAPFEALYGQRCRTPLSWSQTGEHKIFRPELVVEAKEKVKVVQENLRATQSWQKSYFDKRGNLWNSMVVIMFIYGSHQLEAFNTSESEENWPLVISDHMKSSKNVDQLLIDCDSLRSSLQSLMSFTYLSSRSVSEFQLRSLNSKKSLWNQIFHTSNILLEHWIRKKETIVERWWKCIKFSGLITLRKKPPGRRRTISIDISRVFLALPQVPLSLSLLHSSNFRTRSFLRG